jgi:alkanesulfonate monooxygenase SsuD/methylene tetrahydromethanopterin reductase-like flavin-dependent oxidoreductase (luciferase family)
MFTMRFDLRVPGMSPAQIASQYETAIEMVEWAEDKGLVAVIVSEHHASPDGYLPSPVIMATAMAVRTKHVPIAVGAALLPLYNPMRLVEEMIVLDHLSRGRVSYIFGIGYRPAEYELSGIPYEDRGRLADEKLAVVLDGLKSASDPNASEPRVTPQPFTPGGPKISWGGASRVAARRAGRNGLDFFGSGTAPGLEDAYVTAAKEAGHEPGSCMVPMPETPMTVYVNDDQDAGWAEVGPYLLHDVLTYAEWNEDSRNVASLSYSKTVEGLREERGAHRVFTVDEAVDHIGTNFVLPLHPLCGGCPPDIAWAYLRRVVDEVMPRLGSGGGEAPAWPSS